MYVYVLESNVHMYKYAPRERFVKTFITNLANKFLSKSYSCIRFSQTWINKVVIQLDSCDRLLCRYYVILHYFLSSVIENGQMVLDYQSRFSRFSIKKKEDLFTR